MTCARRHLAFVYHLFTRLKKEVPVQNSYTIHSLNTCLGETMDTFLGTEVPQSGVFTVLKVPDILACKLIAISKNTNKVCIFRLGGW